MALNTLALGRTIRKLRQARGLTQRRLAEAADLTVNFLSLVETGNRGLSVDAVNQLAGPLGLPAELIMFLAGDGESAGPAPARYKRLVSTTRKAILALVEAESEA